MDRREFSKTLAVVTAGLATTSPLFGSKPAAPGPLPTRRLGQTDLEVSILALGGFHLGQAGSERSARRLLDAALEEGIRFIDTAESYQSGTSERWIGAALKGRRDTVVLMSKTLGTRSAVPRARGDT